MSGATANHAKKQTKNAIHAKWKARIGIVLNLSSSKRVARTSIDRSIPTGAEMQAICHEVNPATYADLAHRLHIRCARLVRVHGKGAAKWCAALPTEMA